MATEAYWGHVWVDGKELTPSYGYTSWDYFYANNPHYKKYANDNNYEIVYEGFASTSGFVVKFQTKTDSGGGSPGGSGGSSGRYKIDTFRVEATSFYVQVKGLKKGDEVKFIFYNLNTGLSDAWETSTAKDTGVAGDYGRDLSPNTWYSVEVYVNGKYCGDIKEKTKALPYSFSIFDYGDLTVGARIYDSSGCTVIVKITTVDGALIINKNVGTATSANFLTGSIIALMPNTDYIMDVSVDGFWLGGKKFALTIPRPGSWNWTPVINPNSIILLSAEDWNNFTSRINEFRIYKGLPEYSSFTTVVSITANPTLINKNIINEVRTAISQISGHGANYLPPEIKSGDQITASVFNGLKDALNAIL